MIKSFLLGFKVQSVLVITYRLGVVKVNTLYFLRYFDKAYFKINKEKTTKSTLYSSFCINMVLRSYLFQSKTCNQA